MTPETLVLIANTLLTAPPAEDLVLDEDPVVELLSTEAETETETDTSDEARYQRAIAQLRDGVTIGDEQPKQAIAILEQALAALPEFAPQLAEDPEVLTLRAGAYVSLARAYLTVRDEAKARDAMDEGIRSAPFGEKLPADAYGPRVEKLWKKRDASAKKLVRGDVVVNCWVECRIYLNERLVEENDGSEALQDDKFARQATFVALTAGSYRLWVAAADGSGDPLIAEFEPREAGADALEFIFGSEPEPEPMPAPAPAPAPVEKAVPVMQAREKRLLPRPVEISAIAAGVGLIVSGAVLFAINGKCAKGSAKGVVVADGFEMCPSVWTTDIAGIALMGSGVALSATGGILIGLEEVRGARNRKAARVSVGWRFRF